MPLDENVKGQRGARGAAQLVKAAIRADVESFAKSGHTLVDVICADLHPEFAQLIDLQHFDVAPEGDGDLCYVRGDIEHAAVVMPHEPEAIVSENLPDLRSR